MEEKQETPEQKLDSEKRIAEVEFKYGHLVNTPNPAEERRKEITEDLIKQVKREATVINSMNSNMMITVVTSDLREAVIEWYDRMIAPELTSLRTELEALKKERDELRDAKAIVLKIAEWSEKYPRSMVHSMSNRVPMDKALYAIEDEAVAYINNAPPAKDDEVKK